MKDNQKETLAVLLEKTKLIGNVSFSAYLRFLKEKEEQQVYDLKIQLQVSVEKLSSLYNGLVMVLVVFIITSIVAKLPDVVFSVSMLPLDTTLGSAYVLTGFVVILLILVMILICILNQIANRKRKLFIIDYYFSTIDKHERKD